MPWDAPVTSATRPAEAMNAPSLRTGNYTCEAVSQAGTVWDGLDSSTPSDIRETTSWQKSLGHGSSRNFPHFALEQISQQRRRQNRGHRGHEHNNSVGGGKHYLRFQSDQRDN